MEYSKQFNPCFCGIYSQRCGIYSQRILKQWQRKKKESLNPCFCGIYSQRKKTGFEHSRLSQVLILVFVEFTLRVKDIVLKKITMTS